MSKELQVEIQISGNAGSGKAHIMDTIQTALEKEYGHDIRIIRRTQRNELKNPLPPPSGRVRVILTKATPQNMAAINNHQALLMYASHVRSPIHFVEVDGTIHFSVGRQYQLTFTPLTKAKGETISGLVLNTIKKGVVSSYFVACIKSPSETTLNNVRKAYGAFSKQPFNLRWVDYKELPDPDFNYHETRELLEE